MNSKFFAIVLTLVIILLTSNFSYSQSLYKIDSDIGGGGSSNTNVSESNDNTMLYIVGGAVVAGIVIYALLKDKKEKPKDDTTAVILNDDFLEKQLTLNDKIQKYKSKIPINISLGIQNNFIDKKEKRYFVGLAYNF